MTGMSWRMRWSGIRYTWNGDANLDGVINADDYFMIDSGFISQASLHRQVQPPPARAVVKMACGSLEQLSPCRFANGDDRRML
jgi:hypothetical protein